MTAMNLSSEKLRERLDLYEKLMRLDKPNHGMLWQGLQLV